MPDPAAGRTWWNDDRIGPNIATKKERHPIWGGAFALWKLFFFCARVGGFLVCQSGEIIHAGIQSQGDPLALLKGIVPFSAFDFGIVTLINAGQHLHLDLCEAAFFS